VGGWLLVLAASSFWLGILTAGLPERGPATLASWVLLGLGLAAIAALVPVRRTDPSLRSRVMRPFAVGLAFGLLGVGWAGLHEARVSGSPFGRAAGEVVRVEGTLSSDPQEQTFGWSATLRVGLLFGSPAVPLNVAGTVIRLHETLWLEGHGRTPRLSAGDPVAVTGSVAIPRGEFGAYLRHRGYSAALQADQVISSGPPSNPVLRLAGTVRSALGRSVRRVLPPRHAGLLMGLALGDTSRLDPAIEEQFRATGLSHLTAVSGENVAMFLAPILGLALLLRLGRLTRFALGVASVGFFVVLTRAEPSVLRAAVMAGLVMLGIFLGRPRSPPAILGGAVLVLLAFDPTLVYAIGFQLSVAATAGMALLAEPIAARVRFLPRALALAGATTISAQAGVTPLLLYHFGLVPTVTVLANVLAFPAVGPGMVLGLAAAACGLVAKPMGLFLGALARLPLAYLEGLAASLARSPFSSITSSPGHWTTLVIGLALVGVAGWWLHSGRRLPRRAVVAVGLIVPLALWTGALRAGAPSAFTVTFFYVGWGDGALVRSPTGAAIVIDGGSDPELMVRKLASLGVRRVDLLVATHAHADHVGGLPAVLTRFPVGLVVDPGCPGDSPVYQAFLQSVRASGIAFRHPGPGTMIHAGDITVEVLAPQHCFVGTRSDPNNDSVVLRVTHGSASVLFTGDVEQPAQAELVRDQAQRLSVLVLKVPHHGGATNLSSFLELVHAGVAVVSVGPNRYGHPVPAVLQELARDGMRVFRTDRSGDVTVTFRDGALYLSSHRG
jgi:competence protein ComEC